MIRARGRRQHAATWPGFVDAMTGLLLVLMFVLTIFTVVQFTLQDQIGTQESELSDLTAQVASLTDALGLSEGRARQLSGDLDAARGANREQAGLIEALTRERDEQALALSEADARITGFEAQVAGLLADRAAARERVAALEGETARQASAAEALSLALAQARDEVDREAEEARLAAARADALDQLARSLRNDTAEGGEALSEAEAARVAEAAAAEALRARLRDSQAELTAMTLRLEEERRQAEETLTLLAAAEAARDGLDIELAAAALARSQAEARATEAEGRAEEVDARLRAALLLQDQARAERDAAEARADGAEAARAEAEAGAQAAAEAAEASDAELRARLAAALEDMAARDARAGEAMSEAERQAALLATARAQLAEEEALSAEGRREVQALNEQVAELRGQVASLQDLLGASREAEAAAGVRIESLGSDLNAALARAASEEWRRADLEAAARAAAEAEAADLATYRSDFFGRIRGLLEDRAGVQVVGDRFVFSSDVVFPLNSATLSDAGRAQVAQVGALLREVIGEIPDDVPWIIRVDGHTDDSGEADVNWQLSQARALSVVRELEREGIPPERLSANGFGEYQPLDASGTAAARAANRRIEIKLTER